MPRKAAIPSTPGTAAPPFALRRAEFATADEISAALRQGTFEVHPTRQGRYRGRLLHLETSDAAIQWGFHAEPTMSLGLVPDGMFLLRWGEGAPVRCNGQVIQDGVLAYGRGAEHQSRAEGPIGFCSLRVSELETLAAALAPGLALPPDGGFRHLAARAELDQLIGLLHQLHEATRAGGLSLEDPVARQGLRESLGAAVVRVLAGEQAERGDPAGPSASDLVRRVEAYLRQRRYQPVFLSELCAASGASEPRLRRAFLQVFGVGPIRYLRLRRLQMVRRALRTVPGDALTVGAAAARFGFFELGRFAGDYRAVFGERPSATARPH